MDTIYKEKYKGHKIRVHIDFDAGSPREWDNLGKMQLYHSRYDFPQDFPDSYFQREVQDGNGGWRFTHDLDMGVPLDFLQWLEFKGNQIVYLPVYMYEHGNVILSTRSFNGRAQHAEWDSCQIGWVYIERADVLKEFGKQRLTAKLRTKAECILTQEVKTYSAYVNGECYGYTVEDNDGEPLDSCWGYLGDDGLTYALSEAKRSIDLAIKQREIDAQNAVKHALHPALDLLIC